MPQECDAGLLLARDEAISGGRHVRVGAQRARKPVKCADRACANRDRLMSKDKATKGKRRRSALLPGARLTSHLRSSKVCTALAPGYHVKQHSIYLESCYIILSSFQSASP